MSSESDFDINDSDEESVKPTKQTNGKKATINLLSPPASRKRKTRNGDIDDDDDEDDYGDVGDDDEDDFEDTPESSSKKLANKKAVQQKQSASKSNRNPAAQSNAKTEAVKSISTSISTAASSSSSSSSSSSLGAAVVVANVGTGGGDITRGPNITTESAAKKLILQYLKQQNRPYSAIQVFDNLHKRIAKPTAERCLAVLSDNDGGLRCKEYGKAKIYFIDQKNMSSEYTQAQLDSLDKAISLSKKELEEVANEDKKIKNEILLIQSEPTDADLDKVIMELISRVSEKKKRVALMTSAPLPPDALKNAIKSHNFFRAKWRTRKDAVIDVIDAVSDGMEKKSSVVMAGMGMETDEEVSVLMPSIIPEIN